jgi:hypothetical protein
MKRAQPPCAVRDSWRSESGESATVAHEGLLPKDICADRDGRWMLRRFFNFIRSGVLGAVLTWCHYTPSWQVVFVPALAVLTVIESLGVVYLLSALTVTYRDFRYSVAHVLESSGLPGDFSSREVPVDPWLEPDGGHH